MAFSINFRYKELNGSITNSTVVFFIKFEQALDEQTQFLYLHRYQFIPNIPKIVI